MDSSPDESPRGRAISVFGLSLALMFGASFFLEARLWGVNWYGYFGWPVRLVAALTALGMGFYLWRKFTSDAGSVGIGNRTYGLWSATLSLILLAAFYFLRARTHFMGDGYQLIAKLQEGAHTIKPFDLGSFTVQEWVFGLLGGQGQAAAVQTFQLISFACGLIVLAIAVVSGALLFEPTRIRLLWVTGVTSGGFMLLFFGYAENYPLFVTAVLFYAVVGLSAAQGKISRFWIIPAVLIAVTFHIFGLILIPSMVYILLRDTRPSRWLGASLPRVRIWLSLLILTAAAILYIYLYQSSYLFRFNVLPLQADRFTLEGYTLFSGQHLLDYVNLAFQLLPGLLVAIAAGFFCRDEKSSPDGGIRFLIVLGVCSLGTIFLLDPRLGMPRDWDLFAFAGVPLVLIAHYALLRKKAWLASALVSLLGFFMLAPRAATLAGEARGIALFDHYAELDKIKNTAGRFVMFSYLIEHGRQGEAYDRRRKSDFEIPARALFAQGYELREKGYFTQAAARFREVLAYDPSYKAAWTALGNLYLANGADDSARACLEISDGLNPFNFSTNYHLGKVNFALGNYDAAESRWLMAARLAPDKIDPLADLVRLYSILGEHEKYAACLIRLAERSHASPLYLAMIGDFHLLRGDRATARRLYRGALKLGLDPERVRLVEAHTPGFTLSD